MSRKAIRKPNASRVAMQYKPKYGLNILCADEAEQMKLFERLKSEGIKAKVVVV